MRFVYTSDLHGKTDKYSQVVDLVKTEKPDACIFGGDFFEFNRYTVTSKHYDTDHFLRDFFRCLKVPSYVIPGNVDFPMTMHGMGDLATEGFLTILSHTATKLKNLELYGYPFVTPTPFRKKDYERRDLNNDNVCVSKDSYITYTDGTFSCVSESYLNGLPSIEEDLQQFEHTYDASIYVIHVPPAQTGLDMLHNGSHVGSIALRKHILQHQPTISLHGQYTRVAICIWTLGGTIRFYCLC